MKKVLVITPAFPPYQGSQTQRMLSLTSSFVHAGLDVYVLTTEILPGHPDFNPKLLNDVNKKIHIVRTPYGKLHKRIYTKNLKRIAFHKTDNRHTIKTKIYLYLNSIKRNASVPDTMIDWYYAVKQYIKKRRVIESIQPDLIYSCSMPNTSHVIGNYISKKYNIPIMMDYGDPWVFIANNKKNALLRKIEYRMEKSYLNRCLLVSFTTPGAELLYQKKYKLPKEKTITAMTGFEKKLDDLYRKHISNRPKNGKIVLTYGGALQTGVRDPSCFFAAVDEFADDGFNVLIRTDSVSRIKDLVKQNTKNGIIKVEGYKPFYEYYEEMLDADVLVFFGNSTSDQLPGKIFNYFPTRKLILYISNIQKNGKDQALGIVKEYGYYVYADNNLVSIKKALKKVKGIIEDGRIAACNEDAISRYSTTIQMSNLTERVKRIINNE